MPAGRVTAFDERAGWGTIVDGDGVERFFHAVAIADGSRTITVGTIVEFELVPGLLGRWEAASIRRLNPAPRSRSLPTGEPQTDGSAGF